MSELKPCPFCGNEGIQIRYQGGGLDWTIRCKVCGNKTGHHKQRDSAELAWNRRAPDPEKAELVAALRDLLGSAHEPPGRPTQRYYNARGAALALLRRIEGGKDD